MNEIATRFSGVRVCAMPCVRRCGFGTVFRHTSLPCYPELWTPYRRGGVRPPRGVVSQESLFVIGVV